MIKTHTSVKSNELHIVNMFGKDVKQTETYSMTPHLLALKYTHKRINIV